MPRVPPPVGAIFHGRRGGVVVVFVLVDAAFPGSGGRRRGRRRRGRRSRRGVAGSCA